MFLHKNQIVNENSGVASDFKLRTPFASYRPVDYREYMPFVNFTPTIDEYLTKLFAGEIDEGNKDVLDAYITDMAAQAIEDLKKQQSAHADKIHDLYHRRVGDKLAFERHLEQLNGDLERNEEELQTIDQRQRATKF